MSSRDVILARVRAAVHGEGAATGRSPCGDDGPKCRSACEGPDDGASMDDGPYNTAGQVVLHFQYNEVAKGQDLRQNVVLQPGDTVVVP